MSLRVPAFRPGLPAALGAAIAVLLLHSHLAHAKKIEGYISDQSVAQGDTVSFHVNTDAPTFDLLIYRHGLDLDLVQEVDSLAGHEYATPDSAYWHGCGWPAAYVLEVPRAWRSGVYLGKLVAAGAWSWVIFVVREDEPGSVSSILFTTDENTWQAYNGWGGRSLYSYNSANRRRSAKVSFDRPYDGGGYGRYSSHGAAQFVQWAESEGYGLEYAANADLHRDPELLSHYALYLSVGHDEYWSYEMRDQVERFRDRGGNIGVFSANSIYWQVRFEENTRRMVCYKDSLTDPLYGIDNARVTVHWRDPPVNRPEASLIGVQYCSTCCCNGGLGQPARVADAGSWVFQGAGVGPGDPLGTIILGWEWDHTVPGVTPPGVEVVLEAWPRGDSGVPSLHQGVIFQAGGRVFAGGTVQWGLGLSEWWGRGYADPDVQQVTRNILDELRIPTVPASASGADASLPAGPRLDIWPNPVERMLEVGVGLADPTWLELGLYDVSGHRVGGLQQMMPAGTHRLTLIPELGGRRLPRGVYFLRSNLGSILPRKVVIQR